MWIWIASIAHDSRIYSWVHELLRWKSLFNGFPFGRISRTYCSPPESVVRVNMSKGSERWWKPFRFFSSIRERKFSMDAEFVGVQLVQYEWSFLVCSGMHLTVLWGGWIFKINLCLTSFYEISHNFKTAIEETWRNFQTSPITSPQFQVPSRIKLRE